MHAMSTKQLAELDDIVLDDSHVAQREVIIDAISLLHGSEIN